MLSSFAKWSFTLTAIAPALGAAAIISASSHGAWGWCAAFATSAILAVLISCLLLHFVRSYIEQSTLEIDGIEQADQKSLEFLLAYLLPVFSATSLDKLAGSLSLTIYSLSHRDPSTTTSPGRGGD
jgi:hypothetical protein